MLLEISSDVKIRNSVTPFECVGKSPAVDKTGSDFYNANFNVKKIRRRIEQGIYDKDIAHYISGMLDLVFQGVMEKIITIEQPVDTTYSDKEILDFQLILDNNYYTNLKILYICLPTRFRKLTNAAENLDADIYPVNNFFAHWIREIDITKYEINKFLIPTTTPKGIYRYSDSLLKHLPKNALKMIKKDLLYSK